MPIQLRIPLAAASGVFNDCMIVCRLLYHVTVLEAHYTDCIRVCVCLVYLLGFLITSLYFT